MRTPVRKKVEVQSRVARPACRCRRGSASSWAINMASELQAIAAQSTCILYAMAFFGVRFGSARFLPARSLEFAAGKSRWLISFGFGCPRRLSASMAEFVCLVPAIAKPARSTRNHAWYNFIETEVSSISACAWVFWVMYNGCLPESPDLMLPP